MNLIEQLKDPKQAQPFGIYEKYFPEKAEAIETAYPQGCRFFNDTLKDWEDVMLGGAPFSGNTYIFKSDYQPEAEYVNLEITEHDLRLGIKGVNLDLDLVTDFTALHVLPSLPKFHCFWQEETDEGYRLSQHVSIETVATAKDGGNKVYARFRTKKQGE